MKMSTEFILVGQKSIKRSIKPVVIYLLRRYAKNIVQCSLVIPLLGNLKFRGRSAKTRQNENTNHDMPRDIFPSTR